MMRGLLSLCAAVVMFICLGGVFAWSVYVPALRTAFAYSTAQTQLVFGLTVASFVLTMVPAGRLLPRLTPRVTALIGALLFGAGYQIAAASSGSFALLAGGIGIVSGAGIGFGYVAGLSTPMHWFTRHKGFAAGITVAGFGGGAIVTTWWVQRLLSDGMPVLSVIRTVGLVYGVVVFISALLLFRPPDRAEMTATHPGRLRDELGDPFFIKMATGLFCGTFAGLLVIGNLQSIGLAAGLSDRCANLAISAFSVGNASGRIIWGRLCDRFGYVAVPASLILLAAALMLLIPAQFHQGAFIATTLLVGFGFGACFVLYAAQIAMHFGIHRFGALYPLVLLPYGGAGIAGPLLGGWLFDRTGSYLHALLIAILIVCAGVLACRRQARRP